VDDQRARTRRHGTDDSDRERTGTAS
jgi:hypothetical protein